MEIEVFVKSFVSPIQEYTPGGISGIAMSSGIALMLSFFRYSPRFALMRIGNVHPESSQSLK